MDEDVVNQILCNLPNDINNLPVTRRKLIDDINKQKTDIYSFKTEFSNRDKIKLLSNDNIKENMVIVAKIESIYNAIKEVEPYYSHIPYKVGLIVLVNFVLLFTILQSIKIPNGSIYCWDQMGLEFVPCKIDDYCQYIGIPKMTILIDDLSKEPFDRIINEDPLFEIYELNRKLKNYFTISQFLYTNLNSQKLNFSVETVKKFNVKVLISKGENWLISKTLLIICDRNEFLLYFTLIIIFTCLIGYILFGYLADVFGRKRIICTLAIIQSIGCLIMFLFFWKIENDSNESSISIDGESLKSLIKKTSNFLTNSNIQEYTDNFIKVEDYFDKQRRMLNSKSEYYFIYIFGIQIIFTSMCNIPIIFSYVLENSLNDSQTLTHYFKLFILIPISLLISFILPRLYFTYKYFCLGCSVLLIINTIYMLFFLYESPRYAYELRNFELLTNIMKNTVTNCSYISEVTNSPQKTRTKKSLSINPLVNFCILKENLTSNIIKYIKSDIAESFAVNRLQFLDNIKCCLGFRKKLDQIKLIIKNKTKLQINKIELLSQPLVLIFIMLYDKGFKKNFLLYIVFNFVITFIFYLSIYLCFTIDINLRNDLYNYDLYYQILFYMPIIMATSTFIFSFLNNFFGYNIVLFICFIGVIVFSIILTIRTQSIPTYTDMNIYYFGSDEIITSNGNRAIKGLILFFATGLYYVLILLVVKYTKTIYRCTILCIFYFFTYLLILLSFAIFMYFNSSMIYLSLLSIIGFISVYFINDSESNAIISDLIKLEVDENDQVS